MMDDKQSEDMTKSNQGRPFEKTPMYSAINAARYHRQSLIRDIELTQPKLLCYVAGDNAMLDRKDALYFVDMLHNITPGVPLDLLLHTPGGDVDAAEKLITLVRNATTEQGQLRIIVPDYAKSAGTLMTLGANQILMSDASELGPIDPQWPLKDGNGNQMMHSILNYLNAYDEAKNALQESPKDISCRITFEKFDPTVARKFDKYRTRVRDFAENLLKRRGANFSKIAAELMDIDKYPSHGQMIGWEAAQKIGLPITYFPRVDTAWRKYWALYCNLRHALEESDQRIMESYYVSMVR